MLIHLTHSLHPAAGGTTEGLRQLVAAWAAEGRAQVVVSLDAPGTAAPLAGVPVVELSRRHGYGWGAPLHAWLDAHAAEAAGVFIHGLWQYHGLVGRRWAQSRGKPHWVFPHGMLDPWFRRAYPARHLKKQLYWWLAEARTLATARAVCYTTAAEAALARRTFAPARWTEAVVGFGTAEPPLAEPAAQAFLARFPVLRGRPYLLFLSRIHPKKGLDLLLDAWLQRRDQAGLEDLVIAGPEEDPAHAAALRQRLARAGVPWGDGQTTPAAAGPALHWLPRLDGELKWGALAAASALVLPSHQENFGVVVAEALALGTPALLSREVNLWREVVAAQAGFAEPDTLDGVGALLDQWRRQGPAQRARLRLAAQACHRDHFRMSAVATRLETLVFAEGGA